MPIIRDARSKATTTAEYLAAQIDALEEGDRLGTKKELAPQLGVAPGTLNEALRLLQERGLINVRSGPKGGIFVARFDQSARLAQVLAQIGQDVETANGALEVRRSLEDLTILDAARHCRESDATLLRERLTALEQAAEDQADLFAALLDLHIAIARAGNNRMLQPLYLAVLSYLQDEDRRELAPRSRSALKRLVVTHAELVGAIAANDESRCRQLLEEHAADDCELRSR